MTVKNLEICKVTPEQGSVTDMCLPLTFFDLLWLSSQPVEYLFFYEHPSDQETFFSFVLPKLKHSLSLTLEHFLPLAGKLTWTPSSPTPAIRYKKGDGILITIAESDADFFHLSSNNFRETNIFQTFVANINESDSQVPLVALKATIFPNKGFCIGITVHHAIFDGNSFTTFMRAWTYFSKFGDMRNLIPELKPVFDRKIVRESYEGLEKLYIDTLLKQNEANPRSLSILNFAPPPYQICGVFHLSGLDLKRLKDFVRKHGITDCDLQISTFVITYAYLLVCLAKSKVLAKTVQFSIVVDCRSRLEPPISTNYFGNCIGFVVGDVEREKLVRDDGVLAAVYAINRTIKILSDGVLKGAEKWISPDTYKGVEKEATLIYLTGSTRLDPYSVDFGWGIPRKVMITSINKTGSISLMKGRDGDGGVEIELCLNIDEMEKFASAFAQGLAKI